MKIEQAITILKEHNKWRRGTPPYDEVGNKQPYSAKDIGLAIDCVVEYCDDAFIPTAEAYEKGFVQGQEVGEREIIDKACEWWNRTLYSLVIDHNGISIVNKFRKAMLADVSSQLVNANKELTWHKASKELPPTGTEVVCKMKGVPHIEHFVCKWDGKYWWHWCYIQGVTGWFGLNEDWEVVEWKEI